MEDKKLEILLVEDKDEFADVAQKVLESRGYNVDRRINFLEARKAISERSYYAYFVDGIFPYSAEESPNELYQDKEIAREFEDVYNKMAGKKYPITREMPSEVLLPIFDGFVSDMIPYGVLIAQKLKQLGRNYILTSQGAWHGNYVGVWGQNAAQEIGLKAHFGAKKDSEKYWQQAYEKLKGGKENDKNS